MNDRTAPRERAGAPSAATPSSAEIWLGAVRKALDGGDLDAAAGYAQAVDPGWRNDARVCLLLGEVAMFLDDLDAAERELSTSAGLDPGNFAAWHNLGAVAQWRQDFERSIMLLRHALRLEPRSRESARALAHALLAIDRYDEGWDWFEHRFNGQADEPRPRGLWDGSAIPHAGLAVLAEEGLGDTLHFCRYLPQVRDRVGRMYLVVDGSRATLAPLLNSLQGVDLVVTDRRSGPPINAFCPLMTVAHFAGASPRSPGAVPYLAAPRERVDRWRSRLGETHARRVGLVWSGSPRAEPRARSIDGRRSIDPALLAPLFAVPGIEWHLLQLGEGRESRARLPAHPAVVDHAGAIEDFADTAALVANLELTITVDTSVAHLAGAIGAPVYMLNRFDSCWRWGAQGDSTPWYPTMRIFRQHAFGDWRQAIDDLARALALRDD